MGLKPGTDLAAAIETMNRDIGLPLGLRAMGVDESMVDELVRFAATDLASRSNPRPATPEDYRRLFAEAM